MDTNEAAKTLGRLGGLAKSGQKTEAVRKNIEKAIALRKSYKLENEVLRQRINEMRLCMLDSCGKISDEEWRKHVVLIAGDVA
jgi:regulator of replication initiation timing